MRKINEGQTFKGPNSTSCTSLQHKGGALSETIGSAALALQSPITAMLKVADKSLIQNISILVSVEGLQAVKPSQLNDLAGADVTQEHLTNSMRPALKSPARVD